MKVRKKPVEVEALQYVDNPSFIIDWILQGGGTARFHDGDKRNPPSIAIDTLEGTMMATLEDWVIKGVQGEFYPCKPDIFEATYDILEGP